MKHVTLHVIRWLNVNAPVHSVALSRDGHHLIVGSERDLRILNRWGIQHYRYSLPGQEMPFTLAACAPDMRYVLAGRRSGELYYLEIGWQGEQIDSWPRHIRTEPNDVCGISLAASAGLIAIGHLGPALTLLDITGRQVWRFHPVDRNPTNGKTWSVALNTDGTQLYVGSAGADQNRLAVIDVASQRLRAGSRTSRRVTALTVMPDPLAVAAVQNDAYGSYVTGYWPDLVSTQWEHESEMGERFTALASNPEAGVLSVGTTDGRILVLNSQDGAILAEDDSLRSPVTSMAMSSGRWIAAGLADGRVAFLEYTPTTALEDFP